MKGGEIFLSVKSRRKCIDIYGYQTISLLLDQKIITFLKKMIAKLSDKNLSKLIEDSCTKNIQIPVQKFTRRQGTKSQKCTYTFSFSFVYKIKQTGNMSQAVEIALIKKFNLKI